MTSVTVHDPINVNGVDYNRGDVIHGDDADAVLANPIQARCVSRVPEGTFDHLLDAAPAAPDAATPKPSVIVPPPAGSGASSTSTSS
jgi:hypothetical protein